MRPKLVSGVVLFFVLAGVVLLAVLFGPSLLTERNEGAGPDKDETPTTATAANATFQENAQPGTQSWEIPSDRAATTQIQAYASANSVLPGQKLTLYVSTLQPGIGYAIGIYRLGWYGGDGGRLMHHTFFPYRNTSTMALQLFVVRRAISAF